MFEKKPGILGRAAGHLCEGGLGRNLARADLHRMAEGNRKLLQSWRQCYLSTPLISLNSLLSLVPRFVRMVTSATAINEAISAYSIAVAPDSLPTNALRELINMTLAPFCSSYSRANR